MPWILGLSTVSYAMELSFFTSLRTFPTHPFKKEAFLPFTFPKMNACGVLFNFWMIDLANAVPFTKERDEAKRKGKKENNRKKLE